MTMEAPVRTRCMSSWSAVAAVVVLLFAASTPATAIVIRHDRDDARYLQLGSRYPAVCKVGHQMGDGTLVEPDRVLTAAHVARGLGRRGGTVICGDAEYAVDTVYIHPDWEDMGPHDVAVLQLAGEVRGIEPLPLYEGRDEQGKVAVLVGHGASGTGDASDRFDDGQRRGATNVIESANDRYIRFHFDAPPDATDLEGIPGPGDSGGPALIELDGVPYVAGVSSLGEPGANGPGTYGANDYFVRVSTHIDWIRAALDGGIEPYAPRAATVPPTAAGDRLAALVALVEAGDQADVVAFVEEHMVPAPDALDRRVTALRQLVADFDGAQLSQIVDQAPDRIVGAFETAAGMRLLGVEIEADAPGRITGVITGRM